MEDWQQRVVEERNQLQDRYLSLQRTLRQGRPNHIALEDWTDLINQYFHMKNYLEVLQKRISKF